MPRVMMEVDVPLIPLRRGDSVKWCKAANVDSGTFCNVIYGKRYATPALARRLAAAAPAVIGKEIDPAIFINPKKKVAPKPRIVPPVMGNCLEGLI